MAVKTDNNQALTAINKNFNYKYKIRVYTKVGIDPEISTELLKIITKSKGEVSIVTDLCGTLGTKIFLGTVGELRIISEKIHGNASKVEFRNCGVNIKRELADILVISAITHGQDIVLLKTAFIQNKKQNSSESWTIEQGQLDLLMNFPKFTGISGKHLNKREYTFLNMSETLGNYGLFSENDMLLASAKTVFCEQKGKNVAFDDLKSAALVESRARKINPLSSVFCRRCSKNCYEQDYCWDKEFNIWNNLRFWDNSFISLNIYEFIRNLTYFNIGEPSQLCHTVYDKELHEFTCRILFDIFGIGIDGCKIHHHNDNHPKDDSLRCDGNDLWVVFNELNVTNGQ